MEPSIRSNPGSPVSNYILILVEREITFQFIK